jgi:hypothetical protein
VHKMFCRRVGFRLDGGAALRVRDLRQLVSGGQHGASLVNSLMCVGRSVRSTPMQWSFENKKLDCAAKFLSWCPPYVRSSRENAEEECWSVDYMVDDTLGLGRAPCIWWTLNPRYNFAYDIHRLNVGSAEGVAAVTSPGDEFKHVRFDFVKNSPDLCAYMVALRCELLMKIVMPAVVPHSEEFPFLCMGRYEVGKGGNPHVHGFCVGQRAPTLGGRLVMDVDGPDAVEPGVGVECGGADGVGADDAVSVGAMSAGVESANLSSEGLGDEVGVVERCEESGFNQYVVYL